MHRATRIHFTLSLSFILLLLTTCQARSYYFTPKNGILANASSATSNSTIPPSIEYIVEFEPERSLEEVYPTGKYLDPCKASEAHE